MDNSTRRTRFEYRIEIERKFLTPINEKFGAMSALAGMTSGAIDTWRTNAEKHWPKAAVASVANVLLQASARAELLADNSKEVFEAEHRPKPASMDELRDILDEIIEKI